MLSHQHLELQPFACCELMQLLVYALQIFPLLRDLMNHLNLVRWPVLPNPWPAQYLVCRANRLSGICLDQSPTGEAL